MSTQDTTRETLASNEELALSLAELELRVAVHDEILNFLKTILDQLKESGYRLVLTDEQRAQLNRWLGEYEKNPKSRPSRFTINPWADRSWLEEVQRRSAAFDAGLMQSFPAEEVFARVRSRLKQ